MNYAELSSFLTKQRSYGDTMADDFIAKIFGNSIAKQDFRQQLNILINNKDLQTVAAQYPGEAIFDRAFELPPWADTKQMKAGAAFFARHAQVAMNLLGLLSLPYCYAGADGAMVLYLSDRFRNDTGKRLADTGKFVWAVMSPQAFEPDGSGFAACLKTRLIHVAARYYTLQGDQWNMDWGYPINQEDMAGTNLSFSLMVIRGLRKLGYAITHEEQQGYLHLWNVIGYLLGVYQALLPDDGKQANLLEETIRRRQFRTSEQGRILTSELISYFHIKLQNDKLNMNDITSFMRYLLGDEVADCLQLKAEPLSAVKMQFIKAIALLNELKPPSSGSAQYHREYQKFITQVS